MARRTLRYTHASHSDTYDASANCGGRDDKSAGQHRGASARNIASSPSERSVQANSISSRIASSSLDSAPSCIQRVIHNRRSRRRQRTNALLMYLAPPGTSTSEIQFKLTQSTALTGLYTRVRVMVCANNQCRGKPLGGHPEQRGLVLHLRVLWEGGALEDFRAWSSATDIPPVAGATVPSSTRGLSRIGPSMRIPSVRPERPTAGQPSASSFIALNISGPGD